MEVIRRTFEAAQHPKGSDERARLNRDAYRHVDAGPWCATCGAHWCEHPLRGHDFAAA